MTELEAMQAGLLTFVNDPELKAVRTRTRQLYRAFNESPAEAVEERERIAHELFGSMGEKTHVKQPILCDYGFNIHFGDNVFVNCGLTALDAGKVIVEDDVLIGPDVSIYTIEHPVDPVIRAMPIERGRDVRICRGAWIGGRAILNPGVTVGEGAIVGSGAVVTHDIPAHTVAAGAPARVIRTIGEEDTRYWKEALAERERAGLPCPWELPDEE